jgi:SAM-dependent methyltransferase
MLDLSDVLTRKVFFEVYDHLPRGGPGDTVSTLRALGMAEGLPADPQILDIGCGPGMQTLDLARALPQSRIWAIDNHEPFIRQLKLRARGFNGRVVAQIGDMFNLKFPNEMFDLIWSEGAIYFMGFGNGLSTWKPLLKSGGYLAVTEATWLENNPPQEIKQFWQAEYPAMATLEDNLGTVKKNGYEIVGHFALPEAAWWKNFYTPLLQQVEKLKLRYRTDEDSLAILGELESETKMVKQYSGIFNYIFYVCRKTQ